MIASPWRIHCIVYDLFMWFTCSRQGLAIRACFVADARSRGLDCVSTCWRVLARAEFVSAAALYTRAGTKRGCDAGRARVRICPLVHPWCKQEIAVTCCIWICPPPAPLLGIPGGFCNPSTLPTHTYTFYVKCRDVAVKGKTLAKVW